jgi:AcrR family transcriptional regulator
MPNKESPYKRKSARVRQQELIEAGITCLGNGGMSGFTIDQICKTAGVSRGLINHHFKTKEELLIRIYIDMTEHLVDDRIWPSAKQKLKAIIDISFDERSFNRSNLRAWLSIWGQVPNNPVLSKLHRDRYRFYSLRIKNALQQEFKSHNSDYNTDSVARQLIALIDGLWLEYCLNAEGYLLADAKADCYQFLEGYGIRV